MPSYSDFEQRVRRHRPSELLPAIAAAAVEFFEPETWLRNRVVLPWALAAAARTSIVAGNEHRNPGVTRGDILQICSVYNRLDSPLTRHRTETTDTVAAFLVRTGYEQFAAQQSRSEEVARPVALFESVENLETEILSHRLLTDVLGCSISDFIGAGLVIGVGALHDGGFFDPQWPWLWHGPDAINSAFPMDVVQEVFRRHFVTTICDLKEQAERYRQPDQRLRHHEYNPLIARPFVTLGDGRHVAPQPHFAFERLSAAAVYYAAVETLSHDRVDSFTRDLGVVFQDYVGRQLRLMPGATLLPEVFYGNDQRSVDWFVVLDEGVILVEAKTTRLSQFARMGTNRLVDDLGRSIGRAFDQVQRTDRLIADRHPAFEHIPYDRPRRGLVVTLEPYWAANSGPVRDLLPQPQLPVAVASVRSIEQFVSVALTEGGAQGFSSLLNAPADNWATIERPQPPAGVVRNPILEAAWTTLPFR